MEAFFRFFGHATDPDELMHILRKRYKNPNIRDYAMQCFNGNGEVDIRKVYKIAEKLSSELLSPIFPYRTSSDDHYFYSSVTDRNFFYDDDLMIEKGYGLEFLVLDSLFHFRKLQHEQEGYKKWTYSTFTDFIMKIRNYISKTYGKDSEEVDLVCNNDYLSKLMRGIFNPSVYGEFCGVAKRVHEGDGKKPGDVGYRIYKYLDRFQYLLLSTISKNPYAGKQRENFRGLDGLYIPERKMETYYRSLQNFFTANDFFGTITMMYDVEELEHRYASLYLAYRLFDLDTAAYISKKCTSLKGNKLSIEDDILPALCPIFFIPNCFNKTAYVNIIFEVLQSDNYVLTAFDRSQDFTDLRFNAPSVDPRVIQAFNLNQCKRYISFLYSMYFPVLNALFYLLLYHAYGERISSVIEGLLNHLEELDYDDLFSEKMNYWDEQMKIQRIENAIAKFRREGNKKEVKAGQNLIQKLKKEGYSKFKPEEREIFTKYFLFMQHSLCNWIERGEWERLMSLDYLKNRNCQDEIMRVISEYKQNYRPKNMSGGLWIWQTDDGEDDMYRDDPPYGSDRKQF